MSSPQTSNALVRGVRQWVARGGSADLARFKNERGEFHTWMHLLKITPTDPKNNVSDYQWMTVMVLPWVFDAEPKVDGETLECMARLGYFKDFPRVLRNFPHNFFRDSLSPIYGIPAPGVGATQAAETLDRLWKLHGRQQGPEWTRELIPYVMFPTRLGSIVPVWRPGDEMHRVHVFNNVV